MRYVLCMFLAGCWLTSPGRAVHDYEWFHTAYNSIEAKKAQIAAHASILKQEADGKEQQRLRIELTGMQQSCRELVADYNANSDKVNVGIFQGTSLPDHVNPDVCEVSP